MKYNSKCIRFHEFLNSGISVNSARRVLITTYLTPIKTFGSAYLKFKRVLYFHSIYKALIRGISTNHNNSAFEIQYENFLYLKELLLRTHVMNIILILNEYWMCMYFVTVEIEVLCLKKLEIILKCMLNDLSFFT